MLDPGINVRYGVGVVVLQFNQRYSRENTTVQAVKYRVTGGIEVMICMGEDKTAIVNRDVGDCTSLADVGAERRERLQTKESNRDAAKASSGKDGLRNMTGARRSGNGRLFYTRCA